MYRLQKNILVITLMVVFLYCLFIGDARSTSGAKIQERLNKTPGEEKPRKNLNKTLRKKALLTLSPTETIIFKTLTSCSDTLLMNGPLRSKHIEALLSGKYFVTFQKTDLPEDTSLLESLSKQFF